MSSLSNQQHQCQYKSQMNHRSSLYKIWLVNHAATQLWEDCPHSQERILHSLTRSLNRLPKMIFTLCGLCWGAAFLYVLPPAVTRRRAIQWASGLTYLSADSIAPVALWGSPQDIPKHSTFWSITNKVVVWLNFVAHILYLEHYCCTNVISRSKLVRSLVRKDKGRSETRRKSRRK
jgi:hypothetical protein